MNKKLFLWALPFIFVLIIYVPFAFFVMPPFPARDKLQDIGSFGDGFGPFNALFSALGFAGLVLTIFIQQRQIAHQEAYSRQQDRENAALRYEETLFRLLDLYKGCLAAVVTKKGDGQFYGIDALRVSTDKVLKQIRAEKVNHVPATIQRRLREKKLTSDDKSILDFLYFHNFRILNYAYPRQGRLVETLKALLRHLEHNIPDHVERKNYRAIVLSQITYAEVSYFFFVALAYNDEQELRSLFVSSGMIEKASNNSVLLVHRYMYQHYWNYDLKEGSHDRGFPMGKGTVKRIKASQEKLRAELDLALQKSE